LLHQHGDCGVAHAQCLRCLGKASGLQDPQEGLHRIEPVHGPPQQRLFIGVTWLAGFDFEIKVIARIPA
jgi:hypothetical protein